MQTIVYKKRALGWLVYLKEDESIWGSGMSLQEALGDFIKLHQNKFNIKLEPVEENKKDEDFLYPLG